MNESDSDENAHENDPIVVEGHRPVLVRDRLDVQRVRDFEGRL